MSDADDGHSRRQRLVLPIEDFHQITQFFLRWEGRLEQLSRGRFQGQIQIVEGSLVRIASITGNQQIVLQGSDLVPNYIFNPIVPGNTKSTWRGHQFPPGHMVVLGPHAPTDFCSGRHTDHTAAWIDVETFEKAVRDLLGQDEAPKISAWAVKLLRPNLFASITQQFHKILSMGINDPASLDTPDGYRLEQECVRTVIEAMIPFPVVDTPLPTRIRLVRQAIDFMHGHLGDRLGAADLCREMAVNDRTLRLAFHERYGVGPMAYFRCLRLNAVRSMMRRQPELKIADVARQFGFHHLGHFAAD